MRNVPCCVIIEGPTGEDKKEVLYEADFPEVPSVGHYLPSHCHLSNPVTLYYRVVKIKWVRINWSSTIWRANVYVSS
jgi:hypothetical protein